MFSALSQGSLIHILDKTNGLKYKVGEVIGVTQPNGLGGMFSNNFTNPAAPITLKVKIEGEVRDYPDIPSSNSTMSYNNGKIIICETKQGVQLEVENILQNRKHIIANISTYEQEVTDCENILKDLNPQFAIDKERDAKIEGLNKKVVNMEDKLDKILNALSAKTNV